MASNAKRRVLSNVNNTRFNPFTAKLGTKRSKISLTLVVIRPTFAVFTYRLVTMMRLELIRARLIRARVAPQ